MNYIVHFHKQETLEEEEYLVEHKALPQLVKTLLERKPDRIVVSPTEMAYISTEDV